MGLIQTILIALIPIAFIVWRLRRLMTVLRGGSSLGYKLFFGGIVVLGLVARVMRFTGASSASASPPAKAADSVVAPAPTGRAADGMALITKGQHALEKCDTAAATYAFQRAAGVGIEMMNADSLAGEPLFLQGVALAGLHDSTSAEALVTEADRLDQKRGVAPRPDRATTMRHVVALARRKC